MGACLNLNHWADGAWADGSWVAAAWAAGSTPQVVTERFSGGFDYPLDSRGRRQEDIPPKVEAIIQAVAERQAEQPLADAQKRFEELEREISLRGLEWEARYLKALNEYREVLQRKKTERTLLLLAASL